MGKCPSCCGTGECPKCQAIIFFTDDCTVCGGTGHCPACNGSGSDPLPDE